MPKSARTARQDGLRASNPIFNKSLGQHVLSNPIVAQTIVDKASLKPTDVVLEIGAGTGNLTLRIADQAKKVIAIEKDPRLASELVKRLRASQHNQKVEIIVADFMKIDIPYFDVCISNTPYQISSLLVFKLFECKPMFRCAVLMFQREFALRLLAKPGDSLYSRLSANVQLLSRVDHLLKVSRNSFRPPPKVDSSVVRIEPWQPPPPIQFSEWDGLLRLLFVRKNKKVLSNLRSDAALSIIEKNYRAVCSLNGVEPKSAGALSELIAKIVEDSGASELRPCKMGTNDILRLLHSFVEANIRFKS